jgi:hypothetical protein
MKFCRNLRTQVKNRLMVEKFSIFSMDSTCTACEHAFNTVDTHVFLDTTNTVEPGSIVIFGNGVKTEVNSLQFPLLTHNSILSDQDRRSPVKFCDVSMVPTLSPLSRNASNCRESDEMKITPLVTSFSMVRTQRSLSNFTLIYVAPTLN